MIRQSVAGISGVDSYIRVAPTTPIMALLIGVPNDNQNRCYARW